ncbi:MAG: hypothetical protein RI601_12170 [Desulfurivibrionaceae bacterium]|nr:hypothetical protein [Desulfurivibrionaceae bacterium]
MNCSADVTEIAHALNGTAFKSLGTFYLGTLIPDHAPAFGSDQVAEEYSFEGGADDLDISMEAMDDFGDVPDLPGDFSERDFSAAGSDLVDFEEDEISLEGHEVPDMDLSAFEAETSERDDEEKTVISADSDEEDKTVMYADSDDVPEFDLGGMGFEEDVDLDFAPEGGATPDLSDIDLSLGEDELEIDEEEEVDLGDLEMENQPEKEKKEDKDDHSDSQK